MSMDFSRYFNPIVQDNLSPEEGRQAMNKYYAQVDKGRGFNPSAMNSIQQATQNLFSSTPTVADLPAPVAQAAVNPVANLQGQALINALYKLGGGTYEGAAKVGAQYGINLNNVVRERNSSKSQASQTITNIVNKSAASKSTSGSVPYNPANAPVPQQGPPVVWNEQQKAYVPLRQPQADVRRWDDRQKAFIPLRNPY